MFNFILQGTYVKKEKRLTKKGNLIYYYYIKPFYYKGLVRVASFKNYDLGQGTPIYAYGNIIMENDKYYPILIVLNIGHLFKGDLEDLKKGQDDDLAIKEEEIKDIIIEHLKGKEKDIDDIL